MREVNQFEGKKVLVLGLGEKRICSGGFAPCTGADVVVNDSSPAEGNEEATAFKQARDCSHLRRSSRGHLWMKILSLIVKNPGNPLHAIQSLCKRNGKGFPIWTEIELTSCLSEAPIIAITGSNGKTTTTTLLYHMFNIGGKKPLIAGNIGTVSCTVAEQAMR